MTRTELSGSGHTIKMYCVIIVGDAFLASVKDGISHAHESKPGVVHKKLNVWIPLPIVCRALPYLVKANDQVAFAPVSNRTQNHNILYFLNIGLFRLRLLLRPHQELLAWTMMLT